MKHYIGANRLNKAIIGVFCLFLFSGQASYAQTSWVGWPSADESDGRFISVSGPVFTTPYIPAIVFIDIPGDASTFDVELFDGDADFGQAGNYDIVYTTAGFTYTLYQDPLRDGTGTVVETAKQDTAFGNASWSSLGTGLPVSAGALGLDGRYHYRMEATFNGNPSTEPFLNSLKVKARSDSAGGEATQLAIQREIVLVGAPVNVNNDPPLGTAQNIYDGDWNILLNVTSGATFVDFAESDADYINDASNAGAPADDHPTDTRFRVSPDIRYEVIGPDGAQITLNTDPSGNVETETFTYAPPVVVSPGLYSWHWIGVDAANTWVLRTDYDLFTVTETESTAIGNYVWIDENGDGVQDAGEPGLAGVTVVLKDANTGAIVGTRITDSEGNYLFATLPAGNYEVSVDTATLPEGIVQTINPVNPGADFGNQSIPYNVIVGPGESNLTADFGFNWGNPDGNTGTGTIGDQVWVDTNGNGIQDPGEEGIGGVQLTIHYDADGDGAVDTPYTNAVDQNGNTGTGTTLTEPDGSYVFDQLPAGIYVVVVDTPPAGYVQTGDPDDFGQPASNPDNQTTNAVVVEPGDVFLNVDFGYQPDTAPSNSIGDTVYLDANGNGVQDTGEPGIGRVTLSLLDGNGNAAASTVTDADGLYLFDGLADGTYTVVVVDGDNVLGELAQTGDPDGTLDRQSFSTVSGGMDDLTRDFGFAPDGHEIGEGLIGDTIFLDRNGNLSPDVGEGIEGVVVELYDSTGTAMIATTVTNENGNYYFGGLVPTETYTVKVDTNTMLPGVTNVVDPDNLFDSETVVDLSQVGPETLDQDFGYTANNASSLGNLVWRDTNADGVNDGAAGPDGVTGTDDDEPGIEGVTLDLYRDLNANGQLDPGEGLVVGSGVTNANGGYIFANLPGGYYIVDVTDRDGVIDGYWHSLGTTGVDDNSQSDPYAVNLADGGFNYTADFGYYVQPGSIGNFVWNDKNADGIQDPDGADNLPGTTDDETGIAGVLVTLTISYPDGSVVVLNTTTDTSGLYQFDNLLLDEDYDGDANTGAGGEPTFVVTAVTPAGYDRSPVNQGGDDSIDSDDSVNGETAEVRQGQLDDTNDFGFYLPATIYGHLYLDTNGNGTQDAGEPNLADVDVIVTDSNGGTQTVSTDSNGDYSASVPPGATVTDINNNDPQYPSGSMQTEGTDPTTTFASSGESTFTENDGFYYPAMINGHLYLDTNGNGTQDAGEADLADVNVIVTDSSGATQTVSTDGSGNYSATVPPGATVTDIDETDPEYPTGSIQTEGTDPTTTTAVANTNTFTENDGFYLPGSISGWIAIDTDGNSYGDTALPGVELTLLDSNGNPIATTISSAGGGYSFTGLAPGDYTVVETQPVGYTSVRDWDADTNHYGDPDPQDSNTAVDNQVGVTLQPGESDVGNNFVEEVELLNAYCGGCVWMDSNNNGIRDDNERGMGGIPVTLRNSSGNVVATTQTSASGSYRFDSLDEGSYTVSVSIPSGYHAAPQNQGSDDTRDSDINASGVTAVFSLTGGESKLDIDAGLVPNTQSSPLPNLHTSFHGSYGYTVIGNSESTNDQGNYSQGDTSRTLTIPSGASVVGAYLYWSDSGYNDDVVSFNGNTVYADQDWSGWIYHGTYGYLNFYGSFADVTSLVPGSGNYTVANLSWYMGNYANVWGAYGNWSMVVVYEKASLPNKNLYIYKQFDVQWPSDVSYNYNGLIDTQCGPDGKFTLIAHEGDSYKGEYLYVDNVYRGYNTLSGSTAANLDIDTHNLNLDPNQSSVNMSIDAVYENGGIELIIVHGVVIETDACSSPDCVVDEPNPLTRINGHLYLDTNENFTQDSGEPDLANIDVVVTDSGGAAQTVSTDSSGNYTATIVTPGTTVTDIDQNDPDFPAGASQTEGSDPTTTFAVEGANTFTENDGFYVPVCAECVNGVVNMTLKLKWRTSSGDPNERIRVRVGGLGGQVLYDTWYDAVSGDGLPVKSTFSFEVPASATQVVVTVQGNNHYYETLKATFSAECDLVVGSISGNSYITFKVKDAQFDGELWCTDPDPLTQINGHLYLDTNGNFTQDSGEPDLANIGVVVTDSTGASQTISTDASGNYTATVAPGSTITDIYQNDPDFPAGATQTEGTDPTTTFAVEGANTFTENDGFYYPAMINGHLYLDTNGNGTQDAGEPDLANVNVIVTDSSGAAQTVSTDANGDYSAMVTPGAAITDIDENDPEYPTGSSQTEGTDPTTTIVVANANTFTENDGFYVSGCAECVDGVINMTLKLDWRTSSGDPNERIRVRVGGLSGQVLYDTWYDAINGDGLSVGTSFSFDVPASATQVVVTVHGYNHGYETVKATFSADCDLVLGSTSSNSYITFKVMDAQFDGEPSCTNPDPAVSSTFVNAYYGKCMENGASMSSGTDVFQSSCNGLVHQDWEFRPAGSYYEIVNKQSGLCLDVAYGATADQANVWQYSCNQTDAQKWSLQPRSSNYLVIAKVSDKCLEINGATESAYQYPCDGFITQQWQLANTP